MSGWSRWLLGLFGLLLLVFGLGCLNYTKAETLVHHHEVALERGWPPPSRALLYGGVLAAVLGSGLLGYTLGVGRPRI